MAGFTSLILGAAAIREKKKKEQESKQQMRAHQSRVASDAATKAKENRAEQLRKDQANRAKKKPWQSGGKMAEMQPMSPTGATGIAGQAQTVRKTLTGQ
jgi:uncharacterized protein YaiL (DUF2058 family)